MPDVPLALAPLLSKRAELTGEIREHERRIELLRVDLGHIDAAVRLLDPGYKLDAVLPKRRPKRRARLFKRAELSRLALGALREAGGPLTADELASDIMRQKGMDADDLKARRRVENMVRGSLRRRTDLAEKVALPQRAVGWRVRG